MTTKIEGEIYFSPNFKDEKRGPIKYQETINGDSRRTNNCDSIRSVLLDGLDAYIRVCNTDDLGIFIAPEGPGNNRITFTRMGEAWTPAPNELVEDGFPIIARVEGLGCVNIKWTPRKKD
jgi:hypothetical protein